ncbi:MAG: hypothetical protein M0Q53_09575 [Prolixibacteraceae bacterium]|jgi:hypothetical protein|nr:hypothetical protein [Prolixibacteraceae bacterium]
MKPQLDKKQNINPWDITRGRKISLLKKLVVSMILATTSFTTNAQTGNLYIGTASADITPKLPVALMGQFELRIADKAETPLVANVLALESRSGNNSLDAAIIVSCDLIGIPPRFLTGVRDEVHKQVPELDVSKIFLNATHTHTGPVMDDDTTFSFRYPIPKKGVSQVEEFNILFVQRVTAAVVKAWKSRREGSMSWGLSHAAIAYNRRAVFADGSARMLAPTGVPEFRNIEGIEDHDVNILFFWDKQGKLIATTIDVPCPSQEVGQTSTINADYWHPVREKLKQRFGSDFCVLGWCGAAGDQGPTPMYRLAAEERMIRLRQLSHLEEIARRIVVAFDEAYETVKKDRYSNVTLIHKMDSVTLPMQLVTKDEYLAAKAERDKYLAQIAADPKAAHDFFAPMTWQKDVVDRYVFQQTEANPTIKSEVHVIRIGDVAICSSEFELFTDYGIRIQARSRALQTFVVQLAAGSGAAGPSYLATGKAIKGGGYSGIIQSNLVSPEGGQTLVNRTVELINSMWPEVK